jgi:hypothetical protein
MLVGTGIQLVNPISFQKRSDGLYIVDHAGHVVCKASLVGPNQVNYSSDFAQGPVSLITPTNPAPNSSYNLGSGVVINTSSSTSVYSWPVGSQTGMAYLDSTGGGNSDIFDPRIHPTYHINSDTGEVIYSQKPCTKEPCPQLGLRDRIERELHRVRPDDWMDCAASEGMLFLASAGMVGAFYQLALVAFTAFNCGVAAAMMATYQYAVQQEAQNCHFHW